MRYFISFLFCSFGAIGFSQENENFVQKSFTIIHSSKKYNSALKKAQKAANDLQIPMDLRGVSPSKEDGLWMSEVCDCGAQHGYQARGRQDDGTYISIEFSSAFVDFKPDYYIVVVQSGDRKELEMNLSEISNVYKDAYVKDNSVYIGCIH